MIVSGAGHGMRSQPSPVATTMGMTLPFAGRGLPLSIGGLRTAAASLGCDLATVAEVIAVETSGCGFLADRRPKILFERHIFHRETGGRFAAQTPGLSAAAAGGYGASGASQYDRLDRAMALDRDAAIRSCSWGLGQVMGFNAVRAGHADATSMAAAFAASEDAQVTGLAQFCRSVGLDDELRGRRWTAFARHYNGPAFWRRAYDTRLADAYRRIAGEGLPDLRIRAAQMCLLYLGLAPGVIDGKEGPRTTRAIAAFQGRHGLAGTGTIDDGTLRRLEREALGDGD
ncbi:MAG: DUF3380 domain-containing protein [Alphaproteobacteria bacterium]|nr:DUF3380 domain-containing protein [Alphaproteobacteria bacterium]